MKPVIKFYATVLKYLKSDIEVVGAIDQIVQLAKEAKPSWETTTKSVSLLEQCCNRNKEIEDDDLWGITMNDFVKCAFKDLSPLRDRSAMDVFEKVASRVLPGFILGETDLLVWARKIKRRPGGSGVITLHVSDVDKFLEIVEDHDDTDDSSEFRTLEECIKIFT